MSIESEILRIQHNVADTYAAVAGKGGTVPTQPNSANLAAAVASIPAGSSDTTYLLRAPVGTIVIWSGTADNIPTGWQLCDGTNGTPDLRDRFVLGAGSSYSVGAKAGASSVTLSTANMPSHSHAVSSVDASTGSGKIAINLTKGSTGTVPTTVTTSSVGSTAPFSIMPPYYALCYIMKLTADETDGVTQEELTEALEGKQDKLTGTAGQMVGFNAQGQAVAQAVPSTGVTSFKGRTGAVTPQAGDYTATQVGARPSTWTPTAADVGAVPTTRKVNNKALSADISLTAADVGALASGGTAAAATKLATSRTIRTNLGSTSTASFNGTANVTPGVTGTLGIANGGTGSTTAVGALANLGADSRYLKLSGGDMAGMLDMNGQALTGVATPKSATDAVNLICMMKALAELVTQVKVTFFYGGGHYGDYTTYIPIKSVQVDANHVFYKYSIDGKVSVPQYSGGGYYDSMAIYYILGTNRYNGDWSNPAFIPKVTFPDGTIKTASYNLGNNYCSVSLPSNFYTGIVSVSGTMITSY